MKKALTILAISMTIMSCKKSEPQQVNNSCSCIKTKQQLGAWGAWNTTETSQPFIDFCENDGLIQYEGSMTRFVWSCQ